MDEYIKKQDAINLIMSQPTDAHYPSWYADLVKKIPACNVKRIDGCKTCKYFNGITANFEQGYCCLSKYELVPVSANFGCISYMSAYD